MTTNIKPDEEPFGPFTVAEVENCFKAFDLDDNGFVGAGELRKFRDIRHSSCPKHTFLFSSDLLNTLRSGLFSYTFPGSTNISVKMRPMRTLMK